MNRLNTVSMTQLFSNQSFKKSKLIKMKISHSNEKYNISKKGQVEFVC